MTVGIYVLQYLPCIVAEEDEVSRLCIEELVLKDSDQAQQRLAHLGIGPGLIEVGIGFEDMDVRIHGLGGSQSAIHALDLVSGIVARCHR